MRSYKVEFTKRVHTLVFISWRVLQKEEFFLFTNLGQHFPLTNTLKNTQKQRHKTQTESIQHNLKKPFLAHSYFKVSTKSLPFFKKK